MLKAHVLAVVTLLVSMTSCASNGKPCLEKSLTALVADFAAAKEDALDKAMTTLNYDGVIVPHEPGRSQVLSDARLEDINGIPGRELWFRVSAVPCYPTSSLIKQLGGWERISDTLQRTSNSRFTIQMAVEASEPACVRRMRFWKRDPLS